MNSAVDNSENTHNLIDTNEIQNDSSPFISAIEQSQVFPAENTWSTYPFKPVCQDQFENLVTQAINAIAEDNPFCNVEEGEIAAISAVGIKPGAYGMDIRPKVFDNKQKVWTLLDSGSCVSCVPKKPEDKIDHNFKLRAVNGGSIATFGTEIVKVRLGRKEYSGGISSKSTPLVLNGENLETFLLLTKRLKPNPF